MHEVYTHEQARELAALSRLVGRQIGILIDRRGRVEMLLVGEPTSIVIPALPRGRSGSGRLRGLRLLHTHLTPDILSQEDLMDMLFLRLDAIIVLTVSPYGEPVQWQYAHLLPPNPDNAPYLTHPPAPWDKAGVDMCAMIEALEEELARTLPEATALTRGDANPAVSATGTVPCAFLVSVGQAPRPVQEHNLNELAELARTAGLHVAGRMVQRVPQVHHKHILGKGKMAELEVHALQGNAGVLLFDGELSPAQLHNLTDMTERKVLDRTQLILDIFAQHAVSRAGKLQVEMAQLKYTLPRLVGKNRAMDRLMGGIGGRGPGETKLETDRRRVRERTARIKKELETLRGQRAFTRARRARQGIPLAALVGYTNVGKSTLLNTLTRSDVVVADKLFATLDTTTRRLRFPKEREAIVADTVGFIRNLPKELVEAFRATLEELHAAHTLVHVVDIAHPDFVQQMAAVEEILIEMALHEIPRLLVFNKWDKIDTHVRIATQEAWPEALPVSAVTGQGLEQLLAALGKTLGVEERIHSHQSLHV